MFNDFRDDFYYSYCFNRIIGSYFEARDDWKHHLTYKV